MVKAKATDLADASGSIVRTIVLVVGIFLVSRGFLIGVGAATLIWSGKPFNSLEDVIGLFTRFDAGWYLGIVDSGYSTIEPPTQLGATNYAFFPLFPLLVRATKAMCALSSVASGVLVANLAFLGALFAVFCYALCLGLSRRAAALTIVLLAVAPQSFAFSSIYAESLLLLLLASAMLAMRSRKWWLSGVTAALLSATRSNGIMFVAFAVAHLLRAEHWRELLKVWHRPERYVPLVLAPLGLLAFLWFSFLTTGDAFATLVTQREGWGRTLDWPWVNVVMALIHAGDNARYFAISSLLFFGLSLLLLVYRYFEDFVFCLASFMLFWASATIMVSQVRLSITLFPIFIGMARALEARPRLAAAATAGFAGWNAYLMTVWTLASGSEAF